MITPVSRHPVKALFDCLIWPSDLYCVEKCEFVKVCHQTNLESCLLAATRYLQVAEQSA